MNRDWLTTAIIFLLGALVGFGAGMVIGSMIFPR
jgi:hypothetical protein